MRSWALPCSRGSSSAYRSLLTYPDHRRYAVLVGDVVRRAAVLALHLQLNANAEGNVGALTRITAIRRLAPEEAIGSSQQVAPKLLKGTAGGELAPLEIDATYPERHFLAFDAQWCT